MSNDKSLAGTWKARAVDAQLGGEGGKEQIAVMFQFTEGAHQGKHITWFGHFTEKTVDRTIESLRHCGWNSDSLADLSGLGDEEVLLVVEDEEYEGKWRSRVRWVNRQSKLALKNPMDASQVAAFAARLRGKTVASKQKYGAQHASAPQATSSGYGNGSANSGGHRAQQPEYGPDAPFNDDNIPF